MKEFMTIREVGDLFGLSVQTLHYYDAIDLFKPAVRAEKTGYRKYKFDQVYQLASIQYLKKLGYSLDQIKEYLSTRNIANSLEVLKERSFYLHEQFEALIQIDKTIQRKISFIERKLFELKRDSIEVKQFPERRYIPIGPEENLYNRDSFYFYPTIAFYEDELKYFGALIDIEGDGVRAEEDMVKPEETAVLPAGRYLVGYHVGPYEDIKNTFYRMHMARRDLRYGACIAAFNIIDQFVESDSGKFITEIQMKLE
jgi:DNA-binding transcriptional MerR regulator